jgi:hypothetical protein
VQLALTSSLNYLLLTGSNDTIASFVLGQEIELCAMLLFSFELNDIYTNASEEGGGLDWISLQSPLAMLLFFF